jgi:hypothetical protein
MWLWALLVLLFFDVGVLGAPMYDKGELRIALTRYYQKHAPDKLARVEPALTHFDGKYHVLLSTLEKRYGTAVDISPVGTCRTSDHTCNEHAFLVAKEDSSTWNSHPEATFYRLPEGCYLYPSDTVTNDALTEDACRKKCAKSALCHGFVMGSGACLISHTRPLDAAVRRSEVVALLAVIEMWADEVRVGLNVHVLVSGAVKTEYDLWKEKLRAIDASLVASGCKNTDNYFIKVVKNHDLAENRQKVVIVMGDTRPLANWELDTKYWLPSQQTKYNVWDSIIGDKVHKWVPKSPLGSFYKDTAFYTPAATAGYLYAQKHGYEFLYYHFNHTVKHADGHDLLWTPQGERDCTWIKVLALKRAIQDRPDATHFVWLDTDAYFPIAHQSVSEFLLAAEKLSPKVKSAPLLIGTEECFEDSCGNSELEQKRCRYNSGAMLLLNNGKEGALRAFIDKWWDFPLKNAIAKHFLMESYHEQSVLGFMYDEMKEQMVILPQKANLMNCLHGDFIRHLVGKQTFARVIRTPLFSRAVLQQLPDHMTAKDEPLKSSLQLEQFQDDMSPAAMRMALYWVLQKISIRQVYWEGGVLQSSHEVIRFKANH